MCAETQRLIHMAFTPLTALEISSQREKLTCRFGYNPVIFWPSSSKWHCHEQMVCQDSSSQMHIKMTLWQNNAALDTGLVRLVRTNSESYCLGKLLKSIIAQIVDLITGILVKITHKKIRFPEMHQSHMKYDFYVANVMLERVLHINILYFSVFASEK